jgi:hypothetical protein
MAVHRRRPPGLGDESDDIFDLALDRVWCFVIAVAPAVVVDHGEMLRQPLGEWAGHRPVASRSANHDDRRSITRAIERNGRAVS